MRKARSFLSATLADGTSVQAELVHCCHCGQAHGSINEELAKRLKGDKHLEFCSRCNALRCVACVACVPQEQMCENVEAGRAPLDNGTAVKLYLPAAFPGK